MLLHPWCCVLSRELRESSPHPPTPPFPLVLAYGSMGGSRLRVEGRVPLGTDFTTACPALSAAVARQACSQHVCEGFLQAQWGWKAGERGGLGAARRCGRAAAVSGPHVCFGGGVMWGAGEWVGGSAGGTGGPSATCYSCHNDESAARSALCQFASHCGSLWHFVNSHCGTLWHFVAFVWHCTPCLFWWWCDVGGW